MMMSPTAPWYVAMFEDAIENNKPITEEDVDNYIQKHHIKYDVDDGEGDK